MDARKKKELLKKFGENLSDIRKKKGLSLRALADICELDASDIQKYESGQVNPTLVTVVELAMGLGVKSIDLFNFEN